MFETRRRCVQTAFAAGWVAKTQQLQSFTNEALKLAQYAVDIVELATMLSAAFEAMSSIKAEDVKESCYGFAHVAELLRRKAKHIDAGWERISQLAQSDGQNAGRTPHRRKLEEGQHDRHEHSDRRPRVHGRDA